MTPETKRQRIWRSLLALGIAAIVWPLMLTLGVFSATVKVWQNLRGRQ